MENRYVPKVGSKWEHHSGRVYTIIAIANEHSTDLEKFPMYPVYQGTDGKTWVRPMEDFLEKMRPLDE